MPARRRATDAPPRPFVNGLTALLAGNVLFIVGLLQPASPPSDPPFSFSTAGIAAALGFAVVMVEAYPSPLILRSCWPSIGSCGRSPRGTRYVHLTDHLAQGLLVVSLLK